MFLDQFKKPILALAPMDGVTDAPFRFIIKKEGNPDIIFTEFTHVHGLCVAGDKLLHHFLYDESERVVIAQIYGKEPEYFYHATKMVCALGFDGVDINMGCPAKTVTASGAGAGLIRTPALALEIVAAVKEGVRHWVENGEITGLAERTRKHFEDQQKQQLDSLEKFIANSNNPQLTDGQKNLLSSKDSSIARNLIPVSIKTRIGYDKPITEEWISNLDKSNPEWITVHGRTLKQMYAGLADWNEIAKAVKSTSRPILANGDIKSKKDFDDVIQLTKVSGALIGRSVFGNPWTFNELRGDLTNISKEKKLQTMLEQTKRFIEIYPEPKAFFHMRKHFGWYATGFENAIELRKELMQVSSYSELESLLSHHN
jgi:tRNA-dihydrouridine synthase